jgi:catechol 2,3-dioxygenase-like lactoylglutathione lyase family enzyme
VDPRRPRAHARHRAAREDPGGVARILQRIDHVTIGVADLEAGIVAYRRIGFEIDNGGIARNDGDYLQLVAATREGLQSIALASDDPAADSAAVQARRGIAYLTVTARNTEAASRHPNGVQRIERVYIAVKDIAAAATHYARVLGVPPPKMERGTVIQADMAIFQFGPTALGLAQPVAPGVCADALARSGPGPFQILYRTSSMDAAAKWMADHGVPPPVRGVRNTGEQAMLVPPAHACGVYIGFVGPA